VILYADTSALLKLYVEEEGSEVARREVGQASSVGTSLLAYPEMRSALGRALRAERLSEQSYQTAAAAFEEHWDSLVAVDFTAELARLAGELAGKHWLRGSDAVHLASALTLERETDDELVLTAWDADLLTAATAEGLKLAH